MSFSRSNPLGWALYEVLTSAQMNALDIDHANAIDGADGGTYTPGSPLNINNLKSVEWAVTYYPQVTARSSKYYVPMAPSYISDHSASSSCVAFGNDWAMSTTLGDLGWYQKYVDTSGSPLLAGLKIPFAPKPWWGNIKYIGFNFKGAGAHAGLPAIMPRLVLNSVPYNTTTPLDQWSLTDAAASTAIYQASHTVISPELTIPLDGFDDVSWFFYFYGEAAANALVDGVLENIFTLIQVTDIRA